MVKSKVGAEPNKKVKHSFTKDAGIHEGIHRDEPGWYDGKAHCYCFGYGYFFHRGKSLGTKLTPDYIKENWDKEGWCGGLKGACMAIINRERKIAVIKEGTDYSWSIKTGLPVGYTIYKTDEDIPLYDITEPKNKKVLIKMHMTYLIKKYLETYYHEYKVLNSGSKQIPNYGNEHRLQYFTEIKGFANKYKFIPKCKPLYTKPYWINDYKVDFPTIKTILEDKLFTDEELLKINKCKFYTKFCLHKGISWKELDKNWSDDYIGEIKIKDKAKAEAFDKLAKRYADKSEANYKEALSKVNSSVNDWRKPNYTSKIKYIRYYANYYKQDLNSNDYNDLDENAEGQSAIRRGWSDCTNFVSQCLSYGGFQYRKSGLILPHRQSKNWYYDNGKPSHTWGGANNFYQHWESRAGIAKTSDLLTAGDVISVDFTKDGDIDHTAIITSNINNTNESKLLTQHSIDRSEFLPTGDYFSLANLYSQDYKIYGYEMDKAPIK